jgi:hypothetical protein
MNLLSAITLSTKKKAYSQFSMPSGFLSKIRYILDVQEADSDKYNFQLFYVTYPDKAEGKGWGSYLKAEKPHFEKTCSFEELKKFLDERGWDIDEGWMPVEDE